MTMIEIVEQPVWQRLYGKEYRRKAYQGVSRRKGLCGENIIHLRA